jgi:hypothetical protein
MSTPSDPPDPAAGIRARLPLHLVVKNARRLPRSPKNVEPTPSVDEAAYLEAMAEAAQLAEAADPVVKLTSEKASAVERLRRCQLEQAREAASILWERKRAQAAGKDTQRLSSRRVRALQEVARCELDILRLVGDEVDLYGEPMQRVQSLLMSTVRQAAESLPDRDRFLKALDERFIDWVEAAQEVIR